MVTGSNEQEGPGSGSVVGAKSWWQDRLEDRLRDQARCCSSVSTNDGITSAVRTIVRAEGWRALWRGVAPACLSVAPFIAVQQSTYDITKQGVLNVGIASEPSAPMFVGCGAWAGLVAQTLV